MHWLFLPTINVSNVNNLISVEEKLVKTQCNKTRVNLMKKNLFVQIVVKFQSKIVKNMEKIIYNLNVDFVVQLRNGSVGEIHIFVSLVIQNNAKDST